MERIYRNSFGISEKHYRTKDTQIKDKHRGKSLMEKHILETQQNTQKSKT